MEKLEQERHTRTGRTLSILYGLYVMNFGESSDPRVLVELAQEAEQSGWNGFFLTDALMYHANGYEPATNTFVGLAAIASRTNRIHIGSAIAVLPRSLPWQVAREAAAIDQLSNGRMILRLGTLDSTTGGPMIHPVWYYFAHDRFFFFTDEDASKLRNVKSESAVLLHDRHRHSTIHWC